MKSLTFPEINMIYHITTLSAWHQSISKEFYLPSTFEVDGFIHCSDRNQVLKTANQFYGQSKDLLLLEIDPNLSLSKIIFENLEGGEELFPHIYGKLEFFAIKSIAVFEKKGLKGFEFPSTWKKPF
ncbi:MAG: DUF952 domain-containing protein [Chloroflexi bacterium]|nr:DUF952 domain-containing protein [Chloroflexota bacterium]